MRTEAKRAIKRANTEALAKSKIAYVSANHGEALLIRQGTVWVDFFPSTCTTMRHFQGDKESAVRKWANVDEMLNWLKQEIANDKPPRSVAPQDPPKRAQRAGQRKMANTYTLTPALKKR